MGPRTSDGTYQAGLDRGYRVGVIASNDGPGLPGTWGNGIAGIWATDLTRESVWEAIRARRTYGVTGDRIQLWWTLDGHPLGSHLSSVSDRRATVQVDCPRPLDRIEIVHNGAVVESYTHQDKVHSGDSDRYRILVEMGWGPTSEYGDFNSLERQWSGSIRVRDGAVTWVQPRFRGLGQSYEVTGGECQFNVRTSRNETDRMLPEFDDDRTTQGFIVEVDGDENSDLIVDLDGERTLTVPLADAVVTDRLFSFTEESARRLETEFELAKDDVENPDMVYHNAHKVHLGVAHRMESCRATVTFEGLPADDGLDYYYVRAAQRDGQYAWASPIWIEN